MTCYPFSILLNSVWENFVKNFTPTSGEEHLWFPSWCELRALRPRCVGAALPRPHGLSSPRRPPDEFSAEDEEAGLRSRPPDGCLCSGAAPANASCLGSVGFHSATSSPQLREQAPPGTLPAQQPENSLQAGSWGDARPLPLGCLRSQGRSCVLPCVRV